MKTSKRVVNHNQDKTFKELKTEMMGMHLMSMKMRN